MEADVVVIGAGLSGLAAADSLKTHDPSLQVIVLEASDRVGGRTVSGTIGDKSFDLGGQWILPEHKPLLQVRKLQAWKTLYKIEKLRFSTTSMYKRQLFSQKFNC